MTVRNRWITPLLGLLLWANHAAAQEVHLKVPPELFRDAADSSAVVEGFTAGYLDASTIMLGRTPGKPLHLWREAAEIAAEDMFEPELMWLHFGVEVEKVDADTLSATERAYYAGYNSAVEQMLVQEHGEGVFEQVKQEARTQYRLYKGRLDGQSGDEPE